VVYIGFDLEGMPMLRFFPLAVALALAAVGPAVAHEICGEPGAASDP
jgi:hypothetical protein